MFNLIELIRKFRRDESGAFLATFGVMAIVLFALAGSVVDYVTVDQARSRAQLALDAATLALQRDITTLSTATIQTRAEAFLTDRLADTSIVATIAASDVKVNVSEGSLYLRANVKIPMHFVSLVGIKDMNATIVSQSTRKNLYVEVAFVLDNSGSMGSSGRMTNLKSATKSAVNILFYGSDPAPSGATKSANTKVSIVPFDHFVNVGTQYKTASWMDQTGASSISNDNFDDDDNDATPFTGKVNRFALYNSLRNTPWEGCVEARPGQYGVDDTTPTTSVPDTLFVPVFEPDNRDKRYRESGYPYKNDYLPDDGGTCPATPRATDLSDREAQERLCKYANASPSGGNGPNAACLNVPILPLTDNMTNIVNRIDMMAPTGYTNIHQGTIWGFRTLSPSAPFSEGRSYDQATSKVMIIMTDGDNTFRESNNMNGSSHLSAYGHLWNNRLGAPGVSTSLSTTATMDELTKLSCASAKAQKIQIYTIGLAVSSSNRSMLTACASDASMAYFPTDPSELNTVFKNIAEQLAELRLEF